jgi:ribosomal protein S18 acetylase RimI-like enzyme
MKIQPAANSHLGQLVELLGILFRQEAEFTPDAAKQEAGLKMILGHPDAGLILVAEDEGEIVGMVSLLFVPSTSFGGRVAILEDMVVRPEARSSGVGAKLLDAAIASAREQSCLRITLLTDASNTAAQRFYSRAGFAASMMIPLRMNL